MGTKLFLVGVMVAQETPNLLAEVRFSHGIPLFKRIDMYNKKIDLDEVKAFIDNCGPDTKVYLGCDSEKIKINGEVSVMVSTTVCEAVSMGSNPIHHPKFYASLSKWYTALLTSGTRKFDSFTKHHATLADVVIAAV